jgi:hypothetical protein
MFASKESSSSKKTAEPVEPDDIIWLSDDDQSPPPPSRRFAELKAQKKSSSNDGDSEHDIIQSSFEKLQFMPEDLIDKSEALKAKSNNNNNNNSEKASQKKYSAGGAMKGPQQAEAINHMSKRLANPASPALKKVDKKAVGSCESKSTSSKENEEDKMSLGSVESLPDLKADKRTESSSSSSAKGQLDMKNKDKKDKKQSPGGKKNTPPPKTKPSSDVASELAAKPTSTFKIPKTTSTFQKAVATNLNNLVKVPQKSTAMVAEFLSRPENIEKLTKLAQSGNNRSNSSSVNGDRNNRRVNNDNNHVQRTTEMKAKHFKNAKSKITNPRHLIYEKHINQRNNTNYNNHNNNNNNKNNSNSGNQMPRPSSNAILPAMSRQPPQQQQNHQSSNSRPANTAPQQKSASSPREPRFVAIDASNVARE